MIYSGRSWSLTAILKGSYLNHSLRARQEQIQRNRERLKELGVEALVESVSNKSKGSESVARSQKGLGGSRKRPPDSDPPVPTRRSLRAAGNEPDQRTAAGIRVETRGGKVVLESAQADAMHSANSNSIERGPSRPEGDIQVAADNRQHMEEDNFVSTLNEAIKRDESATERKTASDKLSKASLAESDVAKVVPKSCAHIDWLPSTGIELVATGDKLGNVGLWNVQREDESDGVFVQKVHGQYVSGLRFDGGFAPTRCLTCSYDGSVRALDIEKQYWLELYHDKEGGFSGGSVHL